jgi:hypothetical protein
MCARTETENDNVIFIDMQEYNRLVTENIHLRSKNAELWQYVKDLAWLLRGWDLRPSWWRRSCG